eukprot:219314_1
MFLMYTQKTSNNHTTELRQWSRRFYCLLHLETITSIDGQKYYNPNFNGPIINCEENNTCDNSLINGTFGTYLDLNCMEYGCQQALIYCPADGCNIKCAGNSSCYDTQIIYTNTINDNGNVSVQCKDDYSCILMDINAENVYNLSYTVEGYTPYNTLNVQNAGMIDINCESDKHNNNIYGYKVCYYLYVDAPYVNEINISCREYEACYQSQFYVN